MLLLLRYVMLWGCFGWDGVGYACKIDGNMDADLYVSILEKAWLKDHGCEVMVWPPQSPDLNPIEHLWNHLKRKLGEYEEPPREIQELWERVQKEWDNIGLRLWLRPREGTQSTRMCCRRVSIKTVDMHLLQRLVCISIIWWPNHMIYGLWESWEATLSNASKLASAAFLCPEIFIKHWTSPKHVNAFGSHCRYLGLAVYTFQPSMTLLHSLIHLSTGEWIDVKLCCKGRDILLCELRSRISNDWWVKGEM